MLWNPLNDGLHRLYADGINFIDWRYLSDNIWSPLEEIFDKQLERGLSLCLQEYKRRAKIKK